MNRRIDRAIFIGFAFLACAGAYAEASGRGKIVSTVKVYHWNAKKRVWGVGQTIKRITLTFDREGRPAEEVLAGGKGDVLEKTVYRYGKGKRILSVFGPEGTLRRTVTLEREGDLETETAVLPDGGVLFVNQKKYSRSGRLEETRQGGADGRLVFRKTYAYDDAGNLESISVRNPDGGLAFFIEYKYLKFNARGEWTARAEYYTYGDVRRRPHEAVYRTFEERDEKLL
ncbi:MAG: hypothetical protein JXD23_11530 [Spirochaetales bacterium]|nr:hypothetical protein [Spirochaetales bacterium]